jgi:hypothetical protein
MEMRPKSIAAVVVVFFRLYRVRREARVMAVRVPGVLAEAAQDAGDTLLAWAERFADHPTVPRKGGLWFAFYGRVSTEDHQDPMTLRARQQSQAVSR